LAFKQRFLFLWQTPTSKFTWCCRTHFSQRIYHQFHLRATNFRRPLFAKASEPQLKPASAASPRILRMEGSCEQQVVLMRYINPRRLMKYLNEELGPGKFTVDVCGPNMLVRTIVAHLTIHRTSSTNTSSRQRKDLARYVCRLSMILLSLLN